MYSNLVLSGGALKTITILGAVKYLEELNILKDFKQFIGTSAGAIISFLIIIGYSINEIKNIFFTEIINITNINFENITNFIDEYGIDDSSINKNILEKYLFKKINQNDITFIEFTKKFGKNLIITGSNLTTRELDYFNINTSPNMSVITALLITSCVPMIYKPITYNDCVYVDGAIYNNFPFKYFEDKHNDTLGIYIDSHFSNKNETFISYIINIIYSIMNKITYDNIVKNNYNICCIVLEESKQKELEFSFDTLEVNVNNDKLKDMYNYGYIFFKDYFNNILEENEKKYNELL